MTTLRPFFKIRQHVTFCLIAVFANAQIRASAADMYLNGRGDGLTTPGSYSRWAPGTGADSLVFGAHSGGNYTLNAIPAGSGSISLNGLRGASGPGGQTLTVTSTGTTTMTVANSGTITLVAGQLVMINGVAYTVSAAVTNGSTFVIVGTAPAAGTYPATVGSLLTLQAFNGASVGTQTINLGAGGIDLSQSIQNLTINKTNGNGTLALNLTAAQSWLVGTGRTLTVNPDITGSGNLTLATMGAGAVATLSGLVTLTGSLTVNNQSTAATSFSNTGTLTASALTVNSTNTGATTFTGLTTTTAGAITINNLAGATVSLNGGQTTTAGLNVTNAAAGTVTLAGILTGGASAITVNNHSSGTVNLNGTISSAGSLAVVSNNPTNFGGTVNIAGANNAHTGATSLTGGTTNLVYSTNNNNKLADGAALTLNRARLNLTGNAAAFTEIVSNVVVGSGFSQVTRSAGITLLQANAITRSTGAVLDFGTTAIATTDNLNTNGILGGWATINGSDWAFNAGAGDGSVNTFTGYTTNLATNTWTNPVQNIRANAAVTGSITTSATINSLKLDTAAQTITQTVGTTLTIGSGGILTTGAFARTIGTAGAFLTAGTTSDSVMRAGATNSELYFHLNQPAANLVTVNSTITNNSALSVPSIGLTKTQGGTLVLTANNTYTGQTTIGAGTIQIGINGTTGSLGTGAIVNNGTLEYQRSDAVNLASSMTGIGALRQNNATGVLTLSGTNTYFGTTTASLGTIVAGSAGGLSPNSQFVMADVASSKLQLNGFNATIAGLSGGGALGGNVELGANSLTLNGNTTQTYGGVMSGTGSLIKNGTGVLTLPATTSFTGAVTVNAGGLILPSSTPRTSLTATQNSVLTMGGNNTVSGTTTLSNTAVATMNGNNTFTGAVSVNDTASFTATGTNIFTNGLTVATGALLSIPGSNTFGGPVVLNNTAATNLAGNNAFTTLTVNAGNVMLTGNNTSMTALTIGAAMVTANRVGGTIPDSAAVSLNAAGGGLNVLESETIASLASAFDTQVRVATGKVLDISGAGSTTLNGTIAGGGGVNKNGAGVLTLAGGNTFTGAFNINAGSVVVAPNIAAPGVEGFIGVRSAVTLAAGTSLNLALTASRGETVGSLDGAGSVAMGSDGTLRTGANNLNTALYGAITSTLGGTLVKQGFGTMTLAGANTFSTTLRIENGGVTLAHATNTLDDNIAVTMRRPGATLTVTNSETIGTINGVRNSVLSLGAGATLTTTYTDSAAFGRLGTSANGSRVLFGFDPVSIADVTPGMIITTSNGIPSGSVVVQTFGSGANGTPGALINNNTTAPGVYDNVNFRRVGVLSSNITGAGSFTKNGTGTLVLAGNSSHTGNTTINDGAFVLGGIEAGGQYVLGNVMSDLSTVVFAATGDQDVKFANNATNLQSFERVGNIAGGPTAPTALAHGRVSLFEGGNTGTLAFGGNNQTTAFYGSIDGADAAARTMVIKEGTGKFTYTNPSGGFQGIARLEGGEWYIPDGGSEASLGMNILTSLVMSNHDGIRYSTEIQDTVAALAGGPGVSHSFRDGATGALVANYIGQSGGELNLITQFNSFGVQRDGLNDVVTYSGSIFGAGSLTKSGTNTMVLSGSNSFTGRTLVQDGVLQLGYISRSAGVGALAVVDQRGSLSDLTDLELSTGRIFALNSLNETVKSVSANSGKLVLLGKGVLTMANQDPSEDFQGNFRSGGGFSNTGAGLANIGGVVINGGTLDLSGTRTVDGPTLAINGATTKVTLRDGVPIEQGVLADGTRLTFSSGGILEFHATDVTSGEIVGSIHGNGVINLGANRAFTVSQAGGLSAGVYSGAITGSGTSGLVVDGRGALTLSGVNTYAGETSVLSGAQLILDTGVGAGASTVLPSAGAMNLGGGILRLQGGKVQTLGNIAISGGANRLVRDVNASALFNLGTLTASAGGTLFVSAEAGLVTTTSTNTSNILGGWAVHGGSTFARVGITGALEGLADSDYFSTWTSGQHTSLTTAVVGGISVVSGTSTLGLRFTKDAGSPAGGRTVSFTGSSATNIVSGGILVTRGPDNSTSILTAVTTAKLTSSSNQLSLQQYNPRGTLLIEMDIVDNSSPLALAKAGSGRAILRKNTSFSGGLSIGAGTLQVGDEGAVGSTGATGTLGTGSSTMVNNGILDIRRSNSFVLNRGISGSGALIQSGTGDTALANSSTYTGKTNVLKGTITSTTDAALGSIAAGTSVERKAGLILLNSLTAEPIFLKGGFLKADSAAEQSGNVVVTGTDSGIIASTLSTLTVSGRVTSPALSTLNINHGLLFSGGFDSELFESGNVVFTAPNSYGSTHVYGGKLILRTNSLTGTSGTLGVGPVQVDGGFSSELVLDVNDAHRVIANNISGQAGFRVLRNTVYLTGTNTYQGSTIVGDNALQATLRLGNDSFTGSAGSGGAIAVNSAPTGNSQLRTHRVDSFTMNNSITLTPNGDGGGTARNADFVKEGLGNLTLTGEITAGSAASASPNTQRALITVNSGRLIFQDTTISNDVNGPLAINNGTHLEFAGTADYELFGAMGSGGSWVHSTTGTTTLNNTRTDNSSVPIRSTWNGVMYVNRGILKAETSHQFGDDLDIYVTSGASLTLHGDSLRQADRLGGLGVQAGGDLILGDTSGGFDLVIDDAQDSFISGKISGTGSLVWDSANTLTLIEEKGFGRASTFSDNLVIRSGTVRTDSITASGVAGGIGGGAAIDLGPRELTPLLMVFNGITGAAGVGGTGTSLGLLDYIGGEPGVATTSDRVIILHGTNGDTSGGASLGTVGSGGGLSANGKGALVWTGDVSTQDTGVFTATATGAKTFILTGESRATYLNGASLESNTFSGAISEPELAGPTVDPAKRVSLVKNGNSWWLLKGTLSNFSGNIEVNGGILDVRDFSALGNGFKTVPGSPAVARTFTIGTARMELHAADVAVKNFTSTVSWLVNGSSELASSGLGPISIAGTVGAGASSATKTLILTGSNTGANVISSVISGGVGLTKNETGTWRISGNNTFTGNVVVNAGVLEVSGGNAIPDNLAVTLANSGSNGSAPGGATLRVVTSETIGTLSGAIGSVVDVASAQTLTLVNGNTTYQGNITGLGGLTQSTNTAGTARITTLASSASTYTGVTSILAGAGAGAANRLDVSVLADGGFASSIGAATVAAANLVISTGANAGGLRFIGVADSSTNRLFTIGTGTAAASIWADGQVYGNRVPSVSFAGPGAIALSGSGTRTFTLRGANRGDNVFNPVLADNGGATSLTKLEDSVWAIGGNNTFTGAVTVGQGTLAVMSNTALGTSAGGVTVNLAGSRSFLDLRGVNITSGEPLTLNGAANSGFGASTGTNVWTGTVAQNAAASWSVLGASTQLTVSGIVSGASDITKYGDGILVLSGANTNTGIFNARGGYVTLDYGPSNTSKLADSKALVFGGSATGSLTGVQGASTRGQDAAYFPHGTTLRLENGSHLEVVSAVTIDAGASGITRGLGTSTIQLGAITRNVGGSMDFGAGSIATTTTGNQSTLSILGGYATVGKTDWASNVANSIVALAAPSYTNLWSTAANTSVNSASTTGSGLTGSVRFMDGGVARTITLTAAGTITSGGILVSNTAGLFNSTITGSTLTSGVTDLIIHQHNELGQLKINSVITGAISLTKSGLGKLVLTGANNYTNLTIINEGILQVGENAGATGQLGAGNIVLNGTLAFDLSAAGGVPTSLAVLRGDGVVRLEATNLRTILLTQNSDQFQGQFEILGGTLAAGNITPNLALTVPNTLNNTNIVNGNNSLGGTRASANVGLGGTLDLRGIATPNPVPLTTGIEITLGGGILATSIGNSFINGTITISDAASSINVAAGSVMQLNNQIYTSVGMNKMGAGRLVLNAAQFEDQQSGTINSSVLPTLTKTSTLNGKILVNEGELWINTTGNVGGNGNTLFRNAAYFLGATGTGNEVVVAPGATFDLRDADLNYGDDPTASRKIIQISGHGTGAVGTHRGTGALRNTSGTATLSEIEITDDTTIGVGGIANGARIDLQTFDTDPASGSTTLPGVYNPSPSHLFTTGGLKALDKVGTGDLVFRDTHIQNLGDINIKEGELRIERNVPPNAQPGGYNTTDIQRFVIAYGGRTRGDYTDTSSTALLGPIVGARLEFYRNNDVIQEVPILMDGVTAAANGGTNYLELNSDTVPGSRTFLSGQITVYGDAKRNIFNIEGADAQGAVFQQGNTTTGVQGKMVVNNSIIDGFYSGGTGPSGGLSKIGFRELRLTADNSYTGDTIVVRSGTMALPPRSDTLALNGSEITSDGLGESWGEWGMTLNGQGRLSGTANVNLERGGLLTLDNTTRLDASSNGITTNNINDRVNDNASVKMRQGWLRIHSNNDDNIEAIATGAGKSLQSLSGTNLIDLVPTDAKGKSITLTIGQISRVAGSVLRFRNLDSSSTFSGTVTSGTDGVRVALTSIGSLTQVGNLAATGANATDRAIVHGLLGGAAFHTAYEDLRQTSDFWNQERNRQNYTGSHFMTYDGGFLRPLDDSEYATVSNGLLDTASVGGKNVNLTDFAHVARTSLSVNSLRFGPLADSVGNNASDANLTNEVVNNRSTLTSYTNNWQPTIVIDDQATLTVASGMVSSATFAVGNNFNNTTIIRGGKLGFGAREGIINNQNLWLRLTSSNSTNADSGTYASNNFELMTTITGSAGVIKTGPGPVVFDGVNTYTGTTTITEGRLFARNGRNALGANGTGNDIRIEGSGELFLTNGINLGTAAAPKNLNIGLVSFDGQQVLQASNGNNLFNGDIIYDNVDSVGHAQPGARSRISVAGNQSLQINGDIYGGITAVTEDIYYTDSRLLSLNGNGFISIRGTVGDKGSAGNAVPVGSLITAGPSSGTATNENQLMRLQITANDDLNVALEKQYNAAGRLVLDRGIMLVNYDPATTPTNDKGFWTAAAISKIKNGNSNSSLIDNGFSTQHGFIIGQNLGDTGGTQALFLTKANQLFNMSEWTVSGAAGTTLAWLGGTQESGTVGFGAFKADGSLPTAADNQFVGNLTLGKATRLFQQAGGTTVINQRLTGNSIVKVGRGTVVLKNTSALPVNPSDTSVTAVIASDTNTVELGGGTLILDYDGAAIFNQLTVARVGDQNFTSRGGVIQVQGNSGTLIPGTATVTQGLGFNNAAGRVVQFLNGNTTFFAEARGVNNVTINVGNPSTNNGAANLVRNPGATASFAIANTVVGGTGLARINFDFNGNGAAPGAALKNQIIPWATMGTGLLSVQDFAIADATDGNRVRAYIRNPDEYKNAVNTWVAGEDLSENTLTGLGGSGFYGSLATSLAIGTLRFDSPASSAINIPATQTLQVANSGILVSSNVGPAAKTITGGSLIASVLKTGTLISGAATVTGLASTSDLYVGMPVSGANIPSGVYIATIDSASQVTLSGNATGAATLQPLQFGNAELIVHHYGTGDLNLASSLGQTLSTTGSTNEGISLITVASTTGMAPGMTIVSPYLPLGATILTVNSPTSLTLTAPATASIGSQTFTVGISAFYVPNSGTVNGSNVVAVGSTAGLVPGMTIAGQNIPAGSVIGSVNTGAGTVTLLNPAAPTTAANATATSAVPLTLSVAIPLALTVSGPTTTSPAEFGTTGAVVLSGAINAIAGKTTINGGVLSISSDAQLGPDPAIDVVDQLTLNGGTLRWTGQGGIISQTRGITLQGGGGVIEVAGSAGNLVIQRGIESVEQYRGDLIKTGPGTLSLEGDSGNQALFRGLLDVRGGTIRLAGDVPDAAAGTSTIFGSNQTWADGTIMRSGTNIMLQMGDANASGEWVIEEFITFEGNNRLTVGTLGSAVRLMNWNAPIAVNGALTIDTVPGQTFRLHNGGGFIQGSGDITKIGQGILEVRENNPDWTGGLNILEGRVLAANQADVLGTGHLNGKSITLGSTEHAGVAELLLHSDLGTGGSLWEVNMPISVTYNPAQTKRLGVWKQQGNGGQNHQYNGDITLNDNLQLYYEEDNNTFPVGGEFVFTEYNGKFKDGATTSGNLVLRTNVTANGGNDNDATNGRAFITHTFKGDNSAWTGDLVISTSLAYGQDNTTIARLGNNLALTEKNDVVMNYNSILQVGGSTVTIGSLTTNGGSGAFLSNTGTMSSSNSSSEVIENAAATPGVLTINQSTPATVEVLWDAMFRDGTQSSHWLVPGQGAAGASLSLVKGSNGWASLTQNNEYTGTTTIAAGTLQVGVNGVGSTGAARAATAPGLTLNSLATLAGTGLIRGLTTLNGIIKPGDVGGDALGTLTIEGNAVFGAGSETTFQITRPTVNVPDLLDAQYGTDIGTAAFYRNQRDNLIKGTSAQFAAMLSDPVLSNQHDRINITGSATLNAAASFILSLSGYAPLAGDVFKVLDFASVSGAVNVGSQFRLGGEAGLGLSLPFLSDNLRWDTSLFNTNGLVFVVAVTGDGGAPPTPNIEITSPPRSQIVALGATSATFTSSAIGPGNVSSQWRKKTIDIAGSIGGADATYTVTAPGINGFVAADVSKYSVRYTSDAGPAVANKTSGDADLAFVDTRTSTIRVPVNGTTTFNVKAYGPTPANLKYQWLKDGIVISDTTTLAPTKYTGTKTATLTLKLLTTNEAGTYTCRVSIGTGASAPNLEGGANVLTLLQKPIFLTNTLPGGKVSADYGTSGLGYQVLVNTTADYLPTKYTITGQPPGLVIGLTTGIITGSPTIAGNYNFVKITASNAAGSTVSSIYSIAIEGVSTKAIGTYVGLIDRSAANVGILNRNNYVLGGRLDLTTTVKGTFTGKVTVNGLVYPISGKINNSSTNPRCSYLIKRKAPLLNIQVIADLITLDDGGTGVRADTVRGTLQEVPLVGVSTEPVVNMTGWRNVWFTLAIAAKKATATVPAQPLIPANPATTRAGAHNFMLTVGAADQNDAAKPQGASYGTATVATSGIVTMKGKAADGSVIATTAPIGPQGQVAIYQMLYPIKGAMHGTLLIAADTGHTLTGPATETLPFVSLVAPTWNKPTQTLASDRTYKAGFGGNTGLALAAAGGLYKAPAATAIVLALAVPHTLGTTNAQISFADSIASTSAITGGVESSAINPNLDGSSATNPFFEIKPISITVMPVAANNAGLTKATITATTGAVTGSFTLSDASAGFTALGAPTTVTFKRVPAYYGLIIPDPSTPDPLDGKAYGYFIMERLPVPPETLTTVTVPKRSGLMVLDKKP